MYQAGLLSVYVNFSNIFKIKKEPMKYISSFKKAFKIDDTWMNSDLFTLVLEAVYASPIYQTAPILILRYIYVG